MIQLHRDSNSNYSLATIYSADGGSPSHHALTATNSVPTSRRVAFSQQTTTAAASSGMYDGATNPVRASDANCYYYLPVQGPGENFAAAGVNLAAGLSLDSPEGNLKSRKLITRKGKPRKRQGGIFRCCSCFAIGSDRMSPERDITFGSGLDGFYGDKFRTLGSGDQSEAGEQSLAVTTTVTDPSFDFADESYLLGCASSEELRIEQMLPNFGYASLFFRSPDIIRIVYGGYEVVQIVREAVQKVWGMDGIDDEFDFYGAASFKLQGNPFTMHMDRETSMLIKRVGCQILEDMYHTGWILISTSDVSHIYDVSGWFFRYCADSDELVPGEIFCISISSLDSLQLINCSLEIKQVIKKVIIEEYEYGLAEVTRYKEGLEFTLNGNPWHSDGPQKQAGRKLMLSIIEILEKLGNCYFGSVNFKGTADTVFFLTNQIPADESMKFCLLSLDKNDRIRSLNAPPSLVSTIRHVILDWWDKGIKRDHPKDDAWEFKLNGSPWWSSGTESVMARILITKILCALYARGWEVYATLDMSRKLSDKSAFILRSRPRLAVEAMCVALHETDILRLLEAPRGVGQLCREVFETHWPFGLMWAELGNVDAFRSGRRRGGRQQVPEYKFNANPWGKRARDGVFSRAMLCWLLRALEADGWRLVSSADVSSKYYFGQGMHHPMDVDSWFMARPVKIRPEPEIMPSIAKCLKMALPATSVPLIQDTLADGSHASGSSRESRRNQVSTDNDSNNNSNGNNGQNNNNNNSKNKDNDRRVKARASEAACELVPGNRRRINRHWRSKSPPKEGFIDIGTGAAGSRSKDDMIAHNLQYYNQV